MTKPKFRIRRRAAFAVIAIATAAALLLLPSCQTVVPRRDPTGSPLPRVTGESLDGESYTLPDDLLGSPALLLIGYEQDSQFDLDRWLLGVDQMGLTVRIFELPTIPGLAPRMASGFINNGMRSGIPSEDWASVVCVYADAPRLIEFTGNETPLPGRILLLDSEGKVAFFHDRGYSVGSLNRLRDALLALE